MDARVKPAHDTEYVAAASDQSGLQPTLRCPVVLISGPGAGPSSLFSLFPSRRGEWSAGRRLGSLAIGSLRPALRSASLCVLRDARAPGEGPCASRRSIAGRIVGGRA